MAPQSVLSGLLMHVTCRPDKRSAIGQYLITACRVFVKIEWWQLHENAR